MKSSGSGAGRGPGRSRGATDHVGTLFGDHDCRSVGVGRGDRRHYRSVDDAQSLEPVNPQLVVDNCHVVAAHLAGASRVIHGRALLPCVVEQLIVGADLRSRQDLGADIFRKRRRGKNRRRYLRPAIMARRSVCSLR